MLEYLKLKYVDFLLIDIVYENGPIKFFCISAVLMLDVSIDTGLRTFLHLISIYKYDIFVVFDVFDRQGNFYTQCYLHAKCKKDFKKTQNFHNLFTMQTGKSKIQAILYILLIQLQTCIHSPITRHIWFCFHDSFDFIH